MTTLKPNCLHALKKPDYCKPTHIYTEQMNNQIFPLPQVDAYRYLVYSEEAPYEQL